MDWLLPLFSGFGCWSARLAAAYLGQGEPFYLWFLLLLHFSAKIIVHHISSLNSLLQPKGVFLCYFCSHLHVRELPLEGRLWTKNSMSLDAFTSLNSLRNTKKITSNITVGAKLVIIKLLVIAAKIWVLCAFGRWGTGKENESEKLNWTELREVEKGKKLQQTAWEQRKENSKGMGNTKARGDNQYKKNCHATICASALNA